MTQILWGIEAYRGRRWILLPNIIMVDLRSAQFELEELRKNPEPGERYRMVRYDRTFSIPDKGKG